MNIPIADQLDALVTLVIAAALGAVVGLNRESTGRPAGLRTNMLVAIGAALVMAMAELLYPPETVGRLATGVLTGIGFLGGGVILHRKNSVQGVTTAASIWLVAVIGLATGARLYALAAGATLLSWMVLALLIRVSREIDPEMDRDDEGDD